MQPHESGALFGHAQRDAQRERAPRQPMVIIRVPLVLEASCELYSDASAIVSAIMNGYVPV